MDDANRAIVKRSVADLVERLAVELSLPRAAVADIAYLHLQKHSDWGRNPNRTQKRSAHRYWEGQCQECGNAVAFEDAVFHHKMRRIDYQHAPGNLLPYHEECHDAHHGARAGSLSKGSPARKVKPNVA